MNVLTLLDGIFWNLAKEPPLSLFAVYCFEKVDSNMIPMDLFLFCSAALHDPLRNFTGYRWVESINQGIIGTIIVP